MLILTAVVIVVSVWLVLKWRPKANIYKDKTALVIGGSSGLGLALAKDLRRRGAVVAVTSRTKATLTKLKRSEGLAGVLVDVTDDESVSRLPTEYDLVFCCPGFALPGLAKDLSLDMVQRCMETNFYGCVRVVLHYLKAASLQKRTRLVLVSSTLGLHSFIGYGAYSPSKAALRSFYESVHLEAAQEGLDLSIYYCSTIKSPGFAKEELTKPAITKVIEGSSLGSSAEPANRAKVLLDSLPSQHVIFSDLVTQLFSQATDITSLSDYFVWRIAPIFWFIFTSLVKYRVNRYYKQHSN
ncbi:3-dehydrosphinganine reductase [Nematocida homosporus]|uniref:3-dehydrosphinganine reductase n=1 Tax=Nematocida homosporus TaxID=1912981 RepID=UPI00221EE62B|nr:3-dehydrosphinganine reductase [Nematocida homosporus]KAI5184325.1 3-dehydrosphinganine reductase [Nematocida homosporus]